MWFATRLFSEDRDIIKSSASRACWPTVPSRWMKGISREKMRKLAAPWSSLVWKNSSKMEGSLAIIEQSWFKRTTNSVSTVGVVVPEQELSNIIKGFKMGLWCSKGWWDWVTSISYILSCSIFVSSVNSRRRLQRKSFSIMFSETTNSRIGPIEASFACSSINKKIMCST